MLSCCGIVSVRLVILLDGAQGELLPDRQLGADVVCRADEARLGQGAPKDHELPQANRTSFSGDPS